MASRKGINIYIPKYFMAVRNCIKSFVLYGLEVRLCGFVCISPNYVTVGNLNEPLIVLISSLRRVVSYLVDVKKKNNSNLQPLR